VVEFFRLHIILYIHNTQQLAGGDSFHSWSTNPPKKGVTRDIISWTRADSSADIVRGYIYEKEWWANSNIYIKPAKISYLWMYICIKQLRAAAAAAAQVWLHAGRNVHHTRERAVRLLSNNHDLSSSSSSSNSNNIAGHAGMLDA
jgi:hypothetical protein